jgi:hypothetical protein
MMLIEVQEKGKKKRRKRNHIQFHQVIDRFPVAMGFLKVIIEKMLSDKGKSEDSKQTTYEKKRKNNIHEFSSRSVDKTSSQDTQTFRFPFRFQFQQEVTNWDRWD